MHINWKRTVIGGEELHHDFCAYVENINIARIMRDQDADHSTLWKVHFHIGNATSEACLSRREAIEWVEHRFASFLETEAGKEDPQLWPDDQRSAQLRHLRNTDPARYATLVEDLRSARVERICWQK